jgi:hypothetical protein
MEWLYKLLCLWPSAPARDEAWKSEEGEGEGEGEKPSNCSSPHRTAGHVRRAPAPSVVTLSLSPFLSESLTKVIPRHIPIYLLLLGSRRSSLYPCPFFLSFVLEELCSCIDTICGERKSGAAGIQSGKPFTCMCRGVPPTFSRPRNTTATFAAKRHRRSGDLISVN